MYICSIFSLRCLMKHLLTGRASKNGSGNRAKLMFLGLGWVLVSWSSRCKIRTHNTCFMDTKCFHFCVVRER